MLSLSSDAMFPAITMLQYLVSSALRHSHIYTGEQWLQVHLLEQASGG